MEGNWYFSGGVILSIVHNEKIKCYADEGLAGIVVKNLEGKGIFSNKKTTSVNPVVCGDCGFVEWYADEPE